MRGVARTATLALLAQAVLATTTSLALAAPAATEDIRGIRAPIAIPPWWHWPLAIVVAGLASLAVVAALRWWRHRRARSLTPLERARQALLAAEAHARAGRSRECADLLAETVRGAVAARLGTDVLPLTTFELAKTWSTEAQVRDDIHAPLVIELLEVCDLARFARGHLAPDALLVATALTGELVEKLLAPPPHPVAPSRRQEAVPS